MKVLKRSRKPPKAGDIFVYQMPDGLYRYGRVIRDDIQMDPLRGLLLLYFYQAASKVKSATPELRKEELLIPPELHDRGPWTRGYFETIASVTLKPDDILPVHCFKSEARVFEQYVDEYGKRIPRRTKPCGDYGLCSEVTVDVRLSRALGILLSPPNPKHLVGWPRAFYKRRVSAWRSAGWSQEPAEMQALRETVEIEWGERPEDYSWPQFPPEAQPERQRRRVLLPPPLADEFRGEISRYFARRYTRLREEHKLSARAALCKAVQHTVMYMGGHLEDYIWSKMP